MSLLSVSDHFRWTEVACLDGTECPLEYQPHARALALGVLEPVRAELGLALPVISWYRTPQHNRGVGGAVSSQHLTASAVDVRTPDIDDLPKLKAIVLLMLREGRLPRLGGWGWYPGRWVHLDIGPRHDEGTVRHWVGIGTGSELASGR